MTSIGPKDISGQPLGKMELEVLRWLAQGFTIAEIRKATGLSSHETAKYHAMRLYRKLQADNAAHAVFRGIQDGWLDPASGAPNTHAVPTVAADLIRSKVVEALESVRGQLTNDLQKQLSAFSSQFAIAITITDGSKK